MRPAAEGGLRLDRDDPRAWVRVAAIVTDRIESGEYKAGEILPPIDALRAETRLRSRVPVTRGLQMLERQGRLTRIPGLGYRVAPGGTASPELAAALLLDALKLVWDGIYMVSIAGDARFEAWRTDGSGTLSFTTAEGLRDAVRDDWPLYAAGTAL